MIPRVNAVNISLHQNIVIVSIKIGSSSATLKNEHYRGVLLNLYFTHFLVPCISRRSKMEPKLTNGSKLLIEYITNELR